MFANSHSGVAIPLCQRKLFEEAGNDAVVLVDLQSTIALAILLGIFFVDLRLVLGLAKPEVVGNQLTRLGEFCASEACDEDSERVIGVRNLAIYPSLASLDVVLIL